MFLFGDVPIPVTAADQPLRSVFVRDLPVEVPDLDVKSVFESSGVHPCFFREFPSIANVTCRLVMSFRGSIPSSVSVFDFPCVFSMLVIRKLMPLHHGVLVHVFLLRLIIENLSVLSCQK